MKFDARQAWGRMTPSQRRALGEAALLLQVSTEAQAISCEEPDPSPERVAADRRWERAEEIAWGLLEDAVPLDADDFWGPDLAALGIRACRVCCCTDDHACPGGCAWVEPDLCSQCAPAHNEDETPKLGPCCMCEGAVGVKNILMLNQRGAEPGKGWGCVICDLPFDGAYAVLCDPCLADYRRLPSLLKFAVKGYAGSGERIAIAELPEGSFDHDPAVDHD